MSEVWLLEAYEDPFISPHTIGVFDSRDALVAGVEKHFDYVSIDWRDTYVILTFSVKKRCSNNRMNWTERFDFRSAQIGVIDE